MVYFREVQRLWAWLLLLAAISVPMAAIARAMPRGLGDHALPQRLPYVLLGVPALLAIWFSLGALVTEVRETGLSIHFRWLWAERLIPWSQIRSAEAITYSARGWGVRWGTEGMTYNVSGKLGVRVSLAGGESVIVGSQRAYELADAIRARIGQAKGLDPEA